MQVIQCASWRELENLARQMLEPKAGHLRRPKVLFRGHADAMWSLETTLERAMPDGQAIPLLNYYRQLAGAQIEFQSFTNRSWERIQTQHLDRLLDGLAETKGIPHFELMVHFRHHGYPSPLLDWSRSLYVSAFFATQGAASAKAESLAIYAFQEMVGPVKFGNLNNPHIEVWGPDAAACHPRHYVQQAEYTTCLQRLTQPDRGIFNKWHVVAHDVAIAADKDQQDSLTKLVLPRSQVPHILRDLQQYNISDFTLFQSEDALMRTLARRDFA